MEVKSRVNTILAVLGAMAVAGQRMPESAKPVVQGLQQKGTLGEWVRRNNAGKPNRKQRRALAAKLSHMGKPAGSKLARKAAQGRL